MCTLVNTLVWFPTLGGLRTHDFFKKKKYDMIYCPHWLTLARAAVVDVSVRTHMLAVYICALMNILAL